MAARIYLFSYESQVNNHTKECIQKSLTTLYDIKQIHENVNMIKTDDDITILEKYLSSCFDKKESYLIVDITEQPCRNKTTSSSGISFWMDNI
ncbi:hypothetical protein WQ54_21335 [Bacillus sp. SA1-12]|uniref:hypothetical protein n=1 Tax=Bacillus sp. SA1-12 TaxID=1455638 RepID=UPI0006271252|nr:hypothetical protein [Bacillus sp. SA1-12]KKI90491.1 hypothetical protein WQ54_21335 [Bacillus sp. SA1-12]